jgi:hypothetical protein
MTWWRFLFLLWILLEWLGAQRVCGSGGRMRQKGPQGAVILEYAGVAIVNRDCLFGLRRLQSWQNTRES